MAQVSTGQRKDSTGMVGPEEPIAWWKPSAGLSLGELRPRRARLRFTRQRKRNQEAQSETSATSRDIALDRVPLNPGGPVLHAEMGPF